MGGSKVNARPGSEVNACARAILSTKYFDDETELVYYGYRFYSPEMGRFVNRDPKGEDGGINIYASLGNDAIGNQDPLGLEWIIRRNNQVAWARAYATSASDTFDDLGRKLDLDTSDYQKWAHTSDASPVICRKYRIPNTIYFHMGQRKPRDYIPSNIISIWRGIARRQRSRYESEGFRAVWIENVSDSEIENALASDYIYKYQYTGHGDYGGIINTEGSGAFGVVPNRYTQYGITHLRLNSCGSADEDALARTFPGRYLRYNTWEWNVATRGWFVGYRGAVDTATEPFRWRIARGKNRLSLMVP